MNNFQKSTVLITLILLVGLFLLLSLENHNSKEYTAKSVEYNDISHLRAVNGSLGYLAVEKGDVEEALSPFTLSPFNTEEVVAVIDGERVNMSEQEMARTFDVNFPLGPSPPKEKPYDTEKNNETVIVSSFGNITPEHTPIVDLHLLEFNDSVAYSTVQNGSMYFVVDRKPQERFRNIFQPAVVNGELAYGAAEDENNTFIVYNGERIGEEYDQVTRTANVNGQLAYVAYKNNTGFVVYKGEKYGRFLGEKLGKKYFRITHLEGIRGKPFFTGENKTHFFYYHGNKSIGPFKTAALNPVVIDGQIIFDAQIGGEEKIVKWNIAN